MIPAPDIIVADLETCLKPFIAIEEDLKEMVSPQRHRAPGAAVNQPFGEETQIAVGGTGIAPRKNWLESGTGRPNSCGGSLRTMTTDSYFLREHRLIIELIRGTIVFDGMLAARQHEIDSGWIQPDTNTLVVIQGDAIEVRPADLRKYTEWATQHLAPLQGSKTAIVVTSPLPTAVSLLFQDTIGHIRRMAVFSTLAPAADWLGVPVAAITQVAPGAQGTDQS